MTNLLKAMLNLQAYSDNDLNKITALKKGTFGGIRINKVGDPLETFVKDMFCNSFRLPVQQKVASYTKVFSYQGSQNNPPDAMIRGGDALEIKKTEGFNSSDIQLNSSYPRAKLLSTDPMVSDDCRNSENWKAKDVIYCVGHQQDSKLRALIFVAGDCIAADVSIYQNIKSKIIKGLSNLGLPFAKTNELGRLNSIDPLKITKLRIRGMFLMESPIKFFSKIIKVNKEKDMSFFAILRKNKFESFPEADKKEVEKSMSVSDIKLKDPDNPSKIIDAVLISFSF